MATEDSEPVPLPFSVLADRLANRSWDEDVSDDDRLLLEMAATAIRQLITDNYKSMNRAEHLEAYCHALMMQQGGAS